MGLIQNIKTKSESVDSFVENELINMGKGE